jgi:ubiquinone/menaquinone biosynthesis C-methylase UbiE
LNNRDQNTTWLPDKKYYEYAYHKFFNPEVNYANWTPWDEWNYPERDLLRFDHIIRQQVAHIQNKTVLDVACHLGYLSLFCLHNGAKQVTGTNVRDKELSIAKEISQLAGYTNCEFLNSNIYNLEEFYKLCNAHETVLLSGILYHVNNHYQLLKTIADSSAQTLILESSIQHAIDLAEYPIINWRMENTDISTSGFEDDQSITFVGIPNHKWIEQALRQLDFKLTYNEIIEYNDPSGRRTKRCILVGQKV